MSHRWNCPTRWEAERQGERAYERGQSRYNNPYDRWNAGHPSALDHCREAERSWEDGHRQAERRHDEEQAYWAQQEAEYNAAMEAEYLASMPEEGDDAP